MVTAEISGHKSPGTFTSSERSGFTQRTIGYRFTPAVNSVLLRPHRFRLSVPSTPSVCASSVFQHHFVCYFAPWFCPTPVPPRTLLDKTTVRQISLVTPRTMGQSKSKPQADVQPGMLPPLEQDHAAQNHRPWAFTFFPRPEFSQQQLPTSPLPIRSSSIPGAPSAEPQMTTSQTQRGIIPQRGGTITDGQGRQIYVNRARDAEQQRLDQRGGHWMQENPLYECVHMCSTCWINTCTCSCRY